ncbi:MAG: hypothetical protein ABW328_10040 [Ilumatobacteraceae bacterium]
MSRAPAGPGETSKNVLRHLGRWGDIDSPAVLGLWAKEAAMAKLWFGSTVRTLQESPSSAPELVEGVLVTLTKSLYSAKDFSGSPEARRDADEALHMRWPQIKEPVLEQLVKRYTGQLAKALAHTPDGTELVTRSEEVARVRHQPYKQSAYTGYGHDMVRKGDIRGGREVLDVKGCGPLEDCGVDPLSEIWFILKRDPNWIYLSDRRSDTFNWHVAGIAGQVAENTKLAAEFFPMLLQLAGFSLGLSSRLAFIVAGEILSALGDQGVREARGEKMKSALELVQGIGFNVVLAHFTGHLFGTSPGRELVADLEQATEAAAVKARVEIAKTDASVVAKELNAGNGRAVRDAELAGQGYRLEVDVISEGQAHTWRQSREGGWCRFSERALCVGPLDSSVSDAARRHPPNFERDLAAAGVSPQARRALGSNKLSVDDLVAKHAAASEVSTGWTRVAAAVKRGHDELRMHLASEYGLLGYIRYHIRAPGLGRESFPIPLAPTWMNHGANNIETFMRTQRARGFNVRFNATRQTFSGAELRPFFDDLLRNGSPDALGRLANDRGRIERFLKSITYDIELTRTVGGRTQLERWQAAMETGLPPAGGQVRRVLPARVR